jgi:hypothetical protein
VVFVGGGRARRGHGAAAQHRERVAGQRLVVVGQQLDEIGAGQRRLPAAPLPRHRARGGRQLPRRSGQRGGCLPGQRVRELRSVHGAGGRLQAQLLRWAEGGTVQAQGQRGCAAAEQHVPTAA